MTRDAVVLQALEHLEDALRPSIRPAEVYVLLAQFILLQLGRYVTTIGRPLLCAGLMAGALLALPVHFDSPPAELVLRMAVGGLIYAGTTLLLARESLD